VAVDTPALFTAAYLEAKGDNAVRKCAKCNQIFGTEIKVTKACAWFCKMAEKPMSPCMQALCTPCFQKEHGGNDESTAASRPKRQRKQTRITDATDF
jgi:hypothetical protein